MPELPEVEYTARQLRAQVLGATIEETLVFWQRTIGHPGLEDFLRESENRRIERVERRGKYLVIDLSGNLVMTIHRRMTGNLLLLPPGWQIDTSSQENDPALWNRKGPLFKKIQTESGTRAKAIETNSDLLYCRVCFNFADGRRLLYTDLRKFGRIELWPRKSIERSVSEAESQLVKESVGEDEPYFGAQKSGALAAHEKLGPEPLSSEFTVEALRNALAGRKGAIKQVLLDQKVVAGLGNIYADESLFYAYIHPLRRANSLTNAEVEALHEGIVVVLTRSIEFGGTSFSDYRDLWGEAGDNFNHVQVYHRQGKPCLRCGTPIERIVVAQRSTHYCPHCQRFIVE